MASKFHINSSGDVRACNATKRPCKFGEEAHFEDRADARKAVEAKLEEEHGSSSSTLKKSTATLKAELKTELTGMFAVKTQDELSSLIHGTKGAPCPGDCDTCIKFNRTAGKVQELADRNIYISLHENDSRVSAIAKYQVWCERCQDGENAKFYDAADWAENHAKRHNVVIAPVVEAVKAKTAVTIDRKKLHGINKVSSATYERAVSSMVSRSKSIAVTAGLSSYNDSSSYADQVLELPKKIREAERMVFTKTPLSTDDKALLDNAVANYKMDVKEAVESDWDDSDKMTQIERSAGNLSTTFKNLVKAQRGE